MSDEDGRKKKSKRGGGADDWLTTYADMVTLLLTFFVLLMNPDNPIDSQRIELIMQAFQGLGPLRGGNTLSEGILAELGNDVASMPSISRGNRLNEARKKAISEFQPEIQNRFVKIKEDERGLVISLAGDILFKRASAEVDLERSRSALQKLARFLESEELRDRTIRLEGHTDSSPTDPNGPWPTNWELSSARSAAVLHYLVDYGAGEERFQVAGYADTVKLKDPELTEDDRAENRRVDIVILKEAHE
ncbi:MAG: OmpA family protein [Spirochaetaceae bacterium]|nr:OmpA family protein [Spirochaetaceae bacterium]MDT8298333.1 OmpA family protein [Spirochaetaceae bacterium]